MHVERIDADLTIVTVWFLARTQMEDVMSQLNAHQSTGSAQANMQPSIGWNKQLYDGTPVWIRPIDRQDAEMELEFLNRLSPEFRSLRFLGLVHEPCSDVARELTDLDPANAVGLVAVVSLEGRYRQVGAAHFRVNAEGDSCDCSVTVSDEWQKRGVGSSLMRRLIEVARARGIRRMRAYAPAQSDGSHHLALRLGFQRRQDLRDPATVIYHLTLK